METQTSFTSSRKDARSVGRVGSSSLRSYSLKAARCCSVGNSQRLHVRVVRCQAEKQVDSSSSSSSSAAGSRRPIEVSRSIAAARAAESSLPEGLFADPFAAQLLDSKQQQQQEQQQEQLLDVIATRYIDESLLNAMAATNVNSIQSGDYRQVVIIGDGMDCRPFRLPWPPGTLLFLVAPPEGLGKAQLQAVLSEVADCAAFHSLLVGELPGPISKRDAENLLAEAGLLGAVFSHEQEGYGRWQQQDSLQESSKQDAEAAGSSGDELAQRWLCTAQQLRLSLEQMGIYEDWATEFADADAGDDFIGNFS
ncbi:hypothetical protein OEZ85_013224 [Tetradesmus obliquus]|uniref:Uncharacterized protein n=1 Tax=Tetradesmus obliquus TaxID=3088 RepID=A0ABY8U530_TETOB|nr:hypothetical protein OEZ85_013224 [Tetradesmus obliquus]